MRFADIRASIPEYCDGQHPFCMARCTLDMRDRRILDPDCFRSPEWQRLVDKTTPAREPREKRQIVPNRAARRALRK